MSQRSDEASEIEDEVISEEETYEDEEMRKDDGDGTESADDDEEARGRAGDEENEAWGEGVGETGCQAQEHGTFKEQSGEANREKGGGNVNEEEGGGQANEEEKETGGEGGQMKGDIASPFADEEQPEVELPRYDGADLWLHSMKDGIRAGSVSSTSVERDRSDSFEPVVQDQEEDENFLQHDEEEHAEYATITQFRSEIAEVDKEEQEKLRVESMWPSFQCVFYDYLLRHVRNPIVRKVFFCLSRRKHEECARFVEDEVNGVLSRKAKGEEEAAQLLSVVGNYCAMHFLGMCEDPVAERVLKKVEVVTGHYTPSFPMKRILRCWTLCNLAVFFCSSRMQPVALEYFDCAIEQEKTKPREEAKILICLARSSFLCRAARFMEAIRDLKLAQHLMMKGGEGTGGGEGGGRAGGRTSEYESSVAPFARHHHLIILNFNMSIATMCDPTNFNIQIPRSFSQLAWEEARGSRFTQVSMVESNIRKLVLQLRNTLSSDVESDVFLDFLNAVRSSSALPHPDFAGTSSDFLVIKTIAHESFARPSSRLDRPRSGRLGDRGERRRPSPSLQVEHPLRQGGGREEVKKNELGRMLSSPFARRHVRTEWLLHAPVLDLVVSKSLLLFLRSVEDMMEEEEAADSLVRMEMLSQSLRTKEMEESLRPSSSSDVNISLVFTCNKFGLSLLLRNRPEHASIFFGAAITIARHENNQEISSSLLVWTFDTLALSHYQAKQYSLSLSALQQALHECVKAMKISNLDLQTHTLEPSDGIKMLSQILDDSEREQSHMLDERESEQESKNQEEGMGGQEEERKKGGDQPRQKGGKTSIFAGEEEGTGEQRKTSREILNDPLFLHLIIILAHRLEALLLVENFLRALEEGLQLLALLRRLNESSCFQASAHVTSKACGPEGAFRVRMSAMKRRSKTSAALLLPRVSSNQWKNADVLSSFASSSSLSLKRKPVVAIHSSMYITAYVAYAVAIASMMLGRISDAQGLLTFAIQLGARIEQRGRGGLIQSHEGRECKNWDGELGESSLKRMIEDARELFEFIRREGSFPKEENRSNVRLATSHQSRPSTSMRTRSSKGSSLRETTSDVGGRLLLPPRPHSALARIEHGH